MSALLQNQISQRAAPSDPIAARLIEVREALERITNVLLAAQIETKRMTGQRAG
jgi:hypothetical protein